MTEGSGASESAGPSGQSRWNAGRTVRLGARVMVRRHLRGGETSHLYTDVLGEIVGLDPLRVQPKSGAAVEIPDADIEVLKVLPPRPVLVRDIRSLTWAAARGWPGTETEMVGGWMCRAGDSWSYRHGAAVPAEPWALDTDLAEVAEWYAARDLPAWVELPRRLVAADQLLLDGSRMTPDLASSMEAAGSGELEVRTADLSALVPGLSPAAAQAAAAPALPPGAHIELTDTPSDDFLAAYHGTSRFSRELVAPTLAAHTDGVRFAHLLIDGELAAIARGSLSSAGSAPAGSAPATLGISCVETTPAFRRRGLARDVVFALAEWAAAEGAQTAHLHVFRRNTAGLALWSELGFVEHHRTIHAPIPTA